ncbi:MAG: RcnB family protein [Gammaproteobacteria bacterium]|nr:RcnB family protein [Gammaproteobacteria bacterium]
MKKIIIVSTLIIAMTGISVAQADDQWRGQGGGDQRGGQWDHRGGDQRGPQGQDHRGGDRSQWHDNRGGNPNWQGQRYRAPNPYFRPHGYQVRHWRGGDRLPPAYRGRQYYVDYRYYHLNPPPRGYRWVRVDNDVVLAAITTGVILSVVQGLYY